MTTEMIKLRALLDLKGIEWEDKSDSVDLVSCEYHICRTKCKVKGITYLVVHGFGTYGGMRYQLDEYGNINYIDRGLLEVMASDSEPEGWMTAEQVIEYIEAHGAER